MIKVIITKVRLIRRLIVSPTFCFVFVLNIAKKESKTKKALKKIENKTGFIEKVFKKNEWKSLLKKELWINKNAKNVARYKLIIRFFISILLFQLLISLSYSVYQWKRSLNWKNVLISSLAVLAITVSSYSSVKAERGRVCWGNGKYL